MMKRPSRLLVTAAVAMLAACEVGPPSAAEAPRVEAPPPPSVPAPPRPRPTPPPAAATAAPSGPAVAALPPPAVIEPVPAPSAPAAPRAVRLVGLSQTEAEAALGRPATELDRSPARIWQYRSGDCALDLYFYLDVSRNGFYALHYELRGPGPGQTATATAPDPANPCLQRLADARRQPS